MKSKNLLLKYLLPISKYLFSRNSYVCSDGNITIIKLTVIMFGVAGSVPPAQVTLGPPTHKINLF